LGEELIYNECNVLKASTKSTAVRPSLYTEIWTRYPQQIYVDLYVLMKSRHAYKKKKQDRS
jgi:hypothetical protein